MKTLVTTKHVEESSTGTLIATELRGEAHLIANKVNLKETCVKLQPAECVLACLAFVLWLIVFVGGITIDTRPYRCAISSDGVMALERNLTNHTPNPAPCNESRSAVDLLLAAGVILLWFTPVNLALVSASAGALGTFGNLANISDEHKIRREKDNSNPYISAILRGFFVYLLLISGLLLLDVDPLSNPTPGQYIRLAGLLSILSFIVNYQPRLFRSFMVIALRRIEENEGPKAGANGPGGAGSKVKVKRHDTVEVESEETTTVAVAPEHGALPPRRN